MSQVTAGAKWNERSFRSKLALIVALIWSSYTLAHLSYLFFHLGLIIYPVTHRAISAGLLCILVYLLYPPKKGMPADKLHWYDLLPILIIIAGCAYIALNANRLIAEGRLTAYPSEMVLSSLFFICIIEATRRTVGASRLLPTSRAMASARRFFSPF
ncbi:MAG: hypothetical protein MUO52_14095 [Desulfobacterales bacterium]|nr:hypothetical protein [Desulfobacterales bacterium]